MQFQPAALAALTTLQSAHVATCLVLIIIPRLLACRCITPCGCGQCLDGGQADAWYGVDVEASQAAMQSHSSHCLIRHLRATVQGQHLGTSIGNINLQSQHRFEQKVKLKM